MSKYPYSNKTVSEILLSFNMSYKCATARLSFEKLYLFKTVINLCIFSTNSVSSSLYFIYFFI